MKTLTTVTATLCAYLALVVTVLCASTNRIGTPAAPWEIVAASVLLGGTVIALATVAYCRGSKNAH